jgi:hypothetical protein
MSATPATPPELPFGVLAVMIAVLCVLYWRVVLRLVAIGLVALGIYVTYLAIEGLHHGAG